MNIFVLSESPKECAEMMNNKHVVKMPTESAQMIFTIMEHLGIDSPYYPVMLNHPCTIWARESRQNYQWLINHAYELCFEYTRRYGKRHKVEWLLGKYATQLSEVLDLLPDIGLTEFAVAISEDMNCRKLEGFDDFSVIEKYRAYYIHDKSHIADWKTQEPDWWPKNGDKNEM